MSSVLYDQVRQVISNPSLFAEFASGLKLRSYQEEVIRAVVSSVVAKAGLTFVVMFPRQSGKNEAQAQLETYLLTICIMFNVNIIKISPTWKPQSENAMDRLEQTLKRNILVRDLWKKESGYIYRIGESRCLFMSGGPASSIVGATANLLLEVDEAQDISIEKYDKEIAPMVASTNATRVFWGTAWISQTLLGRELRAARQAEAADGIRRTFVLNADQVALEVPAYGRYVSGQVARLGRDHPMIRTQYFSEEIDAQAGMFPPARRALMIGAHPSLNSPPVRREPEGGPISPHPGGEREGGPEGGPFAFLIDCAGQDEAKRAGLDKLEHQGRDSTVLTIVQVDLHHLVDLQAPIYRAVSRKAWTGDSPVNVFGQVRALAESWNARFIVIDATGVGEGLFALLDRAFPGKVIPVKFTQSFKSELGWNYLSIIETGRWLEYAPFDKELDRQLDHCQMEILEGPAKILRWGVPDGTRAPDGLLVHDDMIISNSLAAMLDKLEWTIPTQAQFVQHPDPLSDMEHNY